MENKKTFLIKDENGIQSVAELLMILQIDGIEYAVYSMEKDIYTSDVYVARVVKDQDGNDSIININNNDEKTKVFEVVEKMINES